MQRSALCRSRRELSDEYLLFTCKNRRRYSRERAPRNFIQYYSILYIRVLSPLSAVSTNNFRVTLGFSFATLRDLYVRPLQKSDTRSLISLKLKAADISKGEKKIRIWKNSVIQRLINSASLKLMY